VAEIKWIFGSVRNRCGMTIKNLQETPMRAFRILCGAAVLLLLAVPALAQTGRVEGQVTRDDGTGVGGVTVVVSELGSVEITNDDGSYRFDGVPPGTYTLSFSLGDNADSASGVEVAAGAATESDLSVDWDVSFAETITVFSASRRRERIVEAPAAVTVITQQQIEREATHGQLPKLLEFTPGAEVTQSGLYDFNFNSRGFNSSLNRRVLVLIDGRDPSVIFLSSQEWTSLTVPLDALANVELVRGPGSALYGADAFNGVINMTTKNPRDSLGGRFKFSGGEVSTLRADLSTSLSLGNDWYARVTVGTLESDDLSQSRVDRNGDGIPQVGSEVEYAGLGLEGQPLVRDQNEAVWGNVRVDKNFERGSSLSLEAGYADFEAGGTAVTGIGRVQATSSERPYFRVNFNSSHWNFHAYRNERDAEDTRSLSSGAPLYLFSDKTEYELQANTGFAGGKGRLIGGLSYSEENFDSTNPQGVQTLVFSPVEADYEAVFGQLEYDFSDKLRGVLSLRWDDSSLYDSQVSPRLALVYGINPKNTLRFNYGEAFQAPNYSERFLQVPVAAPLTALAGLEAALCAPFGVTCGFSAVPIKALGNPEVELEEVKSWEVGYSGILGGKTFLTVDYYNNQLENFITDLISSFNPTLGFINPTFGPYVAPGGIPEPFRSILQATARAAVPTLTNDPVTGLALLSALSYTNFGDVDTQGVEIGLNTRINENWSLGVVYNWFDFDVKLKLDQDQLLPNAPENQYGINLGYANDRWDASVKYRHVDGFDWAAGVFQGPIPSYDLVDLSFNFQISDRVDFGATVSNAFDEEHYQIFGGDIITRRALGYISYSW
jgi:iron complex outermembrane receptor protein